MSNYVTCQMCAGLKTVEIPNAGRGTCKRCNGAGKVTDTPLPQEIKAVFCTTPTPPPPDFPENAASNATLDELRIEIQKRISENPDFIKDLFPVEKTLEDVCVPLEERIVAVKLHDRLSPEELKIAEKLVKKRGRPAAIKMNKVG